MFPIEMKYIGKIEAVETVQMFGYSARRIDRNLCDLAYLNFAGPPITNDGGVNQPDQAANIRDDRRPAVSADRRYLAGAGRE